MMHIAFWILPAIVAALWLMAKAADNAERRSIERQRFLEAVDALPDDLRHAFIASFFQKVPYTHLAKKLGLSLDELMEKVHSASLKVIVPFARKGPPTCGERAQAAMMLLGM